MNERIKQLAIEANLISPESNGFDPTRLSIAQQKFAELIVRECADIATMNQHQWASAGSYVLEHFGVEPDVNENLRNRSTYFGNDI
jgi:hypothetical protein